MKDNEHMYNYWVTSETELKPKRNKRTDLLMLILLYMCGVFAGFHFALQIYS